MRDRRSLFARKLRDYRAGGVGGAGRQTQEQLAERLGVSVDAVGKYERSLSFIRGDFERRLVDRLGWSPAEVTACRVDWETHHLRPTAAGYRLFDAPGLTAFFGAPMREVDREVFALLDAHLPPLPDGFAAENRIWGEIYTRLPSYAAYAVSNGQIVGHWALVLFGPEEAATFRARAFLEASVTPDLVHRAVFPGAYFGYCPAVVIARGHDAVAPQLLGAFVAFLEELAAREVVLEGIGATAVTAEGRQFCAELGFDFLGDHVRFPEFGVWELTGAGIARSIFARRSRAVRLAYDAAFGQGGEAGAAAGPKS